MNAILSGKGAYRFWTMAQRIFVVLFMLLMLSAVGFFAWSAMDREAPVTVDQIRIIPPIVRPGQSADIEFTIRRHRVCAVRGEGYVYDGANVRWPYQPSTLRTISDTLGREVYAVKRTIPISATPGAAFYRISLYHVCPLNLFHLIWPITDVVESLSFEIVPP